MGPSSIAGRPDAKSGRIMQTVGMAITYTHLDADTHITEPPDVWTARVPARYRDHVPQVVRDADGNDVWVLDGKPISQVGFTALAGWPTRSPTARPHSRSASPRPTTPTPASRTWTRWASYAQVLYPNVAGFGSQRFLSIPDDELKLLCVRAYNDFLRDWASADPRRLITIMATPFWDIDADGRRGRARHRARPPRHPLHRRAAAVRAAVPRRPALGPVVGGGPGGRSAVHFHIGSGEISDVVHARAGRRRRHRRHLRAHVGGDVPRNGMQVADLLTVGRAPAVPRAEVRVGRERHRMDPVRARGRRPQLPRGVRGQEGRVGAAAVGVLPAPGVRVLLVREAAVHDDARRSCRSTTSSSRPTSPTRRASTATSRRRSKRAVGALSDEHAPRSCGTTPPASTASRHRSRSEPGARPYWATGFSSWYSGLMISIRPRFVPARPVACSSAPGSMPAICLRPRNTSVVLPVWSRSAHSIVATSARGRMRTACTRPTIVTSSRAGRRRCGRTGPRSSACRPRTRCRTGPRARPMPVVSRFRPSW